MKKLATKKKKRSKNLSPVMVQNIRDVSEILGNMIPATSQFGKGLETVFDGGESKINYLIHDQETVL